MKVLIDCCWALTITTVSPRVQVREEAAGVLSLLLSLTEDEAALLLGGVTASPGPLLSRVSAQVTPEPLYYDLLSIRRRITYGFDRVRMIYYGFDLVRMIEYGFDPVRMIYYGFVLAPRGGDGLARPAPLARIRTGEPPTLNPTGVPRS